MANTCSPNSVYTLPCRASGGIQSVYVGTWNGTNLGYIYDSGTSSGAIAGFTGSTVSFYQFEQPTQTAGYSEAGTGNVQNGTFFVEGTLTVTLQQMTQAITNILNTLGAAKLRVIILDQNGNYWLMGKVNPVYVNTTAGGLGTAFGDLNGQVVTFTSDEPSFITQVDTAAALSVIVSASL